MEIEEIYEMTAVDLVMRKDELGDESVRTPLLHDKYLRLYGEEWKQLNRMNRAMARYRLTRVQYYLGKASPEVYKLEPFDLKVKPIKSDLSLYLDADEGMHAVQEAIDGQEFKVKFLVDTLRGINGRSYLIRSAVDDWKFRNGVN